MNRSSGISNTAPSGSAAANTLLSAEVSKDLAVGNNTIPHGVTGTILNIEIKDTSNRKPDFSDFYWSATEIFIYSPIAYSVEEGNGQITFVISYTA